MLNLMSSSLLAGVFIGIGCIANVKLGYPVGSFVFTIGLLNVLFNQSHLYTGKIGYITSTREYPKMLLILLFNFIGAYLVGLLSRISGLCDSSNLMSAKLSLVPTEVFGRAILCGMLMYLAVKSWRDNYIKVVNCFLCVFTFVACGFEHCVADVGYLGMCDIKNCTLFFILVIIGNSVGSQLLNILFKIKGE